MSNVEQVIAEVMQAYKAGSNAFHSGKAMPSGYKPHEQDCFKMGFKAQMEGEQYIRVQEGSFVDSGVVVEAYSDGCTEV